MSPIINSVYIMQPYVTDMAWLLVILLNGQVAIVRMHIKVCLQTAIFNQPIINFNNELEVPLIRKIISVC